MRSIVLFSLIGAAFALPAELVPQGFTMPGGQPLKSDLAEEPQPVKTVNKIPIYSAQAINEFNYDYAKQPFYPYFDMYNKNYFNYYPTPVAPFGFPQYYPQFYPNRPYFKNYSGQYSYNPFYPAYGSRYANYGSQYQLPQYYKQFESGFNPVLQPYSFWEKSGLPVPRTPAIN